MRRFFIVTLIIVGLFLTIPFKQAHAFFIVDTGPGPDTSGGRILFHWDILGFYHYLAGQFTITEAYNIHSLEGWIGGTKDGEFNTVIYSDNDNTVNQDNEIFRYLVTASKPSGDAEADWIGATGLDFLLGPGTYWLAFEPLDGFARVMPSPVAAPLDNYAYARESTEGAYVLDTSSGSFGFRIDASPVKEVIPEPTTMILLSSGLVGLFYKRKLRSK